MTRKPLERHLQKTILRRLTLLAREDPTLVFRKRHGAPLGINGDSDLYGCWEGIHFELELKRPGEAPTELQKLRQGEWARAGAVVAVVHSVEEFEAFLYCITPVRGV